MGTKEYYELDTRVLLTALLYHIEHTSVFDTFMYSDQESELILLDLKNPVCEGQNKSLLSLQFLWLW